MNEREQWVELREREQEALRARHEARLRRIDQDHRERMGLLALVVVLVLIGWFLAWRGQ